MASFTALVPLNLHWYGNALVGAAGTTHRIPDAHYDEFHVEVEPNIPGGVTWRSLVDDSNPAVVTLSSLTATTARFVGSPWIDAKAYGAVGDGVTDDTAALQIAINALTGTYSELFIPAGSYKITSALLIPYVFGKKIRGQGNGGGLWTNIIQSTLTTPIIKTQYENTHSIELRDITLSYVSQASNSGAMAIQFSCVSAGGGGGFYNWVVENIRIQQAHTGIGISGTGLIPVWGSRFVNCWLSSIQSQGIYLVSPTVAGMPTVRFDGLKIFNTNTTVKATGVAITINAAEVVFDELDVEGWVGQVLSVNGGPAVHVRQVHIESHSATAAGSLFTVGDGPLIIDNASLAGTINASGSTVKMFQATASASLTVDRVRLGWTLTAGTIVLTNSDSTARGIWITDPIDLNSNVSIPAHTGDATTLARIRFAQNRYGFGPSSGTTFPTAPLTNDRFFRTDRGLDYYYDGTRWLTTQLYREPFAQQEALAPYAATATVGRLTPWNGTYDLWLDTLYLTAYVITTNTSAAFWTFAVIGGLSGSTLASQSTSAVAADGFRRFGVSIGALLGTAETALELKATKTSTPGNTYIMASLAYRLVG